MTQAKRIRKKALFWNGTLHIRTLSSKKKKYLLNLFINSYLSYTHKQDKVSAKAMRKRHKHAWTMQVLKGLVRRYNQKGFSRMFGNIIS